MVLSDQGQGIFDCGNGEKLARINNDLDWVGFDDITNSIAGFSAVVGVLHQQPSSRASNTAICPAHITPPAATSRPPQKFVDIFFCSLASMKIPL